MNFKAVKKKAIKVTLTVYLTTQVHKWLQVNLRLARNGASLAIDYHPFQGETKTGIISCKHYGSTQTSHYNLNSKLN